MRRLRGLNSGLSEGLEVYAEDVGPDLAQSRWIWRRVAWLQAVQLVRESLRTCIRPPTLRFMWHLMVCDGICHPTARGSSAGPCR